MRSRSNNGDGYLANSRVPFPGALPRLPPAHAAFPSPRVRPRTEPQPRSDTLPALPPAHQSQHKPAPNTTCGQHTTASTGVPSSAQITRSPWREHPRTQVCFLTRFAKQTVTTTHKKHLSFFDRNLRLTLQKTCNVCVRFIANWCIAGMCVWNNREFGGYAGIRRCDVLAERSVAKRSWCRSSWCPGQQLCGAAIGLVPCAPHKAPLAPQLRALRRAGHRHTAATSAASSSRRQSSAGPQNLPKYSFHGLGISSSSHIINAKGCTRQSDLRQNLAIILNVTVLIL